MRLPTGGGFSQQISGKINLDVSGFQADAQRIANIAQQNARKVAKAYQLTAQQSGMGLNQLTPQLSQQRREIDSFGKAAVRLEKQRQREIQKTDRDVQRSIAQQRRELERQGKAAIRLERQRRREMEATAKAEKRALAEVARLRKKPYDDLRVAIGEARNTLLAFTGAAAGLIAVGAQAADNIYLLTIRYRELAGSAEEGNRLMRQVEQTARDLNLPVRQLQETFLGLIPSVKQAGGSLEEYTNVALRLATLNTDARGGIEGAIYAIREAIASGGTDLVSLSERFNIPRKLLREYIEEYGDLAKALDVLLNQYGATNAVVEANARSLNNLRRVIVDTAQRALERTFAGALETVKTILEGLNETIENTPQWMLDLAASATIAVGGVSALILATAGLTIATNQGLTALRAYGAFLQTKIIPSLRTAAAATARFATSQAALRVGVGAAAVAGGTALGIGIVNAAGRATGDERLENFGLRDAFETLKQVAFLITNLILGVLEAFAQAVTRTVIGIKNLGLAAQDLGLRFTILYADLGLAIQDLLGALGDANERARLQGVRQTAVSQLDEVAAKYEENVQAAQESVSESFRQMRLSILNIMYPTAREVEQETRTIGEAFSRLILDIKTNLYEFLGEQGDAFAGSADNLVNFRKELDELFEEGNIDSLESRLRGLERERAAIESVLPELQKHAEYSDEAAEKLAEYNSRLNEIAQQLPQFIQALEAATQRAITDAINTYADAVTEAETKRANELAKLAKDVAEQDKKLRNQEADKLQDIRDKELEAENNYHEAVIKAEEAYRKRMLQIQRDFIRAVTTAASELDAAGVIAAIQARNDQRREAGEQRSEARQQAQERLDELRIAAAQELDDLRNELAERRAEMDADRKERFAAIQQEYKDAEALAREARNNELQEIATYYNQRYHDLVAYQEAERALRLQMQAQYLSDLANAVIMPTLESIMGSPAVQSLLKIGGGAINAISGGRTGSFGIGNMEFHIQSNNPHEVAQQVNAQIVRLAGGGRTRTP